jgi:hypothetical protein
VFDDDTSYRSNFKNFFPAAAQQNSSSSSKNSTFRDDIQGRTEQQRLNGFQFEIGNGKSGSEVTLSSEYRDCFVDFVSPKKKERKEKREEWTGERPTHVRDVWDGIRSQ